MLAVVQLAMILVMVVVLDAIVNSKLFEGKSDCTHKCDTKSKTKKPFVVDMQIVGMQFRLHFA